MKYLLDSHTFLWWESDAARLSEKIHALFRDRTNIFFLSVVSVWEMQIKLQTGKLKLTLPLDSMVEKQMLENQIMLLPVLLAHVFELDSLPMHHRDPFDRLIIAQARVEGAVLITQDSEIAKYPVRVIW